MDRKIYSSGASSKSSSASTQQVQSTNLSIKQVGGDSRQALTKAIIPGVNCLRPLDKVSTPDGQVQAIVMADAQDLDIHPDATSTVHGYALPDQFTSWVTLGTHASTDKTTYSPSFSKRVAGALSFHGLWHAHYVYKLVCKVPLTANTRVYVSWNVDGGNVNNTLDAVGFEWSPTEANTIYLVIPWSNPAPLKPTSEASNYLDSIFGSLTMEILGSTAEIDPVISVYGAPTKLTGHGLNVYPFTGISLISSNEYSSPFTDLPSSYAVNPKEMLEFYLTMKTKEGTSVDFATTPFEVTFNIEGSVDTFLAKSITAVGGGPGLEVTDNSLVHLFPGNYTIAPDTVSVPSDCECVLTVNRFSSAPQVFKEQMDTDLTDVELPGSPKEDDIPSKSPALMPDIEEGSHDAIPTVPVESLRETNQFYPVYTTNITDEPFGIFALFDTDDRQTFNVNTCRFHLLKKYPKYKLKATTAISNPAKLRIVQLPFWLANGEEISYDDLFELPAIEWDVKDGDLDLDLYWDHENPAKVIPEGKGMLHLTPPLAYQVISRNGTEPIPVTLFINIPDDNFAAVRQFIPLESSRIFEEQMDVSEQPSERFNTPSKPSAREQGPTVLSTIWNYVSSTVFTISSSDPSLDVIIPVDPRNFGPYMQRESRRYALWRGDVDFKILFQTPRTIAGTLTVAHVDNPDPKTPEQLRQYPHVVTQDNSEVEMSTKWRSQTPWKYTGFTGSPEEEVTNGFLYFKYEPVNGLAGDSSARVTVYSDSSNVQMVRPRPYTPLTLPSGFKKVKIPDNAFKEQMDERDRTFMKNHLDIVPETASMVYMGFEERLKTFPKRHHPWARQLARNGFVFAKSEMVPDSVWCVDCGITIGRWEYGDYIPLEHSRHAERKCRFLDKRISDLDCYSPYSPRDLDWFARSYCHCCSS